MLIRLTGNLVSKEFGNIAAGHILHFPDKVAVELLNAGVAEPVKTAKKETALKP
jgi:hypothetical protein